jgi:hypothetical protein
MGGTYVDLFICPLVEGGALDLADVRAEASVDAGALLVCFPQNARDKDERGNGRAGGAKEKALRTYVDAKEDTNGPGSPFRALEKGMLNRYIDCKKIVGQSEEDRRRTLGPAVGALLILGLLQEIGQNRDPIRRGGGENKSFTKFVLRHRATWPIYEPLLKLLFHLVGHDRRWKM